MNWGFIILVGTMLFFAALHQWPPDGRRWQREELDDPVEPAVSARAEPPPPDDSTTRPLQP